jgi:hypothetical protein
VGRILDELMKKEESGVAFLSRILMGRVGLIC